MGGGGVGAVETLRVELRKLRLSSVRPVCVCGLQGCRGDGQRLEQRAVVCASGPDQRGPVRRDHPQRGASQPQRHPADCIAARWGRSQWRRSFLLPAAPHLRLCSSAVDIMTHVAWRQSGLPPTHVIGAGCNLDSERLSHILNINLNTRKPAWVLGELSDSVPGSAGPRPQLPVLTRCLTVSRAFEMMRNRGQRSWSVGLSVADITNSVLTDRRKTHSVSTLAQGWGGISTEVFLSLPCIMGANGSTRLVGALLGQEEDARLRDSVASLSTLMSQLRV
uniref:Lactate/malate dehydrogenase C-terminal domain-containing protein n=1 Tax=Oryzias sinensis TaxID=183150 RepID=A0A8C7XT80_9TELE